MRGWSLFCGLGLIPCLIAPQLRSQNFNVTNELNLGIAANQKAKYEEAIEHLERAVTLDPGTEVGHFYLANSYDNMYSEECDHDCAANDRWRALAIQEYKKVLDLNPAHTEALKSLACRCYRSARFEEAENYYKKTIEVDPNDVEALYTLAAMHWQRSYMLRMQRRAQLNLPQKKPLIALPACTEMRLQNLSRVEEGVSLLTRASQNLNSYDVLVYLGLLYRERADIQCGDRSAYNEDMKTALHWVRLACEARHDPGRTALPWRWPPAPPPPAPGHPGACPD